MGHYAINVFWLLLGSVLLASTFYLMAGGTTHGRRLQTWWLERRRRRYPAPPSTPPIEQLAADLRRLRHSLLVVSPTAPLVRQRALYLAYDQVLVTAADTVAVAHHLEQLPLGAERDVERLQLEAELERAGFVLSA